ncbi:unnamed protein product [Eruca vesicaria subsp. sativa]|uniref:Uncharacterized protein n=1 Tax=Eruca vesicaria subsp. sativa TaxID=29727 RepID=A0ABC8LIR5_ERUVS|nr:unnamed protein product [Eruca vesicaria subsp. sativa]
MMERIAAIPTATMSTATRPRLGSESKVVLTRRDGTERMSWAEIRVGGEARGRWMTFTAKLDDGENRAPKTTAWIWE